MTLVGLGARRALLDTSARARFGHPAVRDQLAVAARSGRLVSCGAVVVEALYSAQSAEEAEAMHSELVEGMPYADSDEAVWRLAQRAQLELAQVVDRFQRRPPIDYLIAATAHRRGLDVLHYDADYDLIAEHSSLEFESRWLAQPGSL